MNKDKKNYNKLKNYLRLILKNRRDLDVTVCRSYTCFTNWMREIDIVNYLTNLDETFTNSYFFYQ